MAHGEISKPQLLATYKRGDEYFLAIAVILDGGRTALEICVSKSGYHALLRVFETRPFDTLDPTPYLYYYDYSSVPDSEASRWNFYIRIRRHDASESKTFEGPALLVGNLSWLSQLRSTADAPHLRQIPMQDGELPLGDIDKQFGALPQPTAKPPEAKHKYEPVFGPDRLMLPIVVVWLSVFALAGFLLFVLIES